VAVRGALLIFCRDGILRLEEMEANGPLKIAVLGAESTGKTWLCENLAAHFGALWVPEYARDYFNGSSIYNYTQRDLLAIAREQLEMERRVAQKSPGLLICDTSLITLKIWAQLEFAVVPLFIEEEVKRSNYHHYFITDNEIEWVQDDLRQNKFSRDLILELNIREVEALGATYHIISGRKEERLNNAVVLVEGMISAEL
jgi:nicotinamide riboside kinase